MARTSRIPRAIQKAPQTRTSWKVIPGTPWNRTPGTHNDPFLQVFGGNTYLYCNLWENEVVTIAAQSKLIPFPLKHPSLVAVTQVYRDDQDLYYVVLEEVPKTSLHLVLAVCRSFTKRMVVYILKLVLMATQFLLQNGIRFMPGAEDIFLRGKTIVIGMDNHF